MSVRSDADSVPILPSELVIMISQLLCSGIDVLSFSLTCKRYYKLVLENVKQKGNKQAQQLLSLHTTKIIGRGPYYDKAMWVSRYYVLPYGRQHGKYEEWMITRPMKERLLEIVKEDSVTTNCYPTQQEAGYVFQPERHQEVEDIIHHCGLLHKVMNMFFGNMEGVSRQYNSDIETSTMILEIESTYVDGQLHGQQNIWYPNGKEKIRRTYDLGKKTGLEYEYTYFDSPMLTKSTWKDDKRHGEMEEYELINEYPVLQIRSSFANGHRNGITQVWEPSTGVRTEISNWDRGRHIYPHERFDPVTAIRTNFMNQNEDIHEEFLKLTNTSRFGLG